MKYYEAWKVLEKDLCLDYCSFPEPFSPQIYFLCYREVCSAFDAKADLDKKLNQLLAVSHPHQPSSSSPPSSNPSWPFPSGNKKTSFPSYVLKENIVS